MVTPCLRPTPLLPTPPHQQRVLAWQRPGPAPRRRPPPEPSAKLQRWWRRQVKSQARARGRGTLRAASLQKGWRAPRLPLPGNSLAPAPARSRPARRAPRGRALAAQRPKNRQRQRLRRVQPPCRWPRRRARRGSSWGRAPPAPLAQQQEGGRQGPRQPSAPPGPLQKKACPALKRRPR
jgi:hypothetical protein